MKFKKYFPPLKYSVFELPFQNVYKLNKNIKFGKAKSINKYSKAKNSSHTTQFLSLKYEYIDFAAPYQMLAYYWVKNLFLSTFIRFNKSKAHQTWLWTLKPKLADPIFKIWMMKNKQNLFVAFHTHIIGLSCLNWNSIFLIPILNVISTLPNFV